MLFQGSAVALVTPFLENGEIDYEGMRELVRFHLEHGTDAIVSMGTTGEVSTSRDDEHIEAIRVVVEEVAGRIPVIAGTAINDTRHSITLSRMAEDVGADGLLLVTPYYNKGTAYGLYEHFRQIAESVQIPSILYTVPGRTAVHLSVDLVRKLSEVPNIVGIKDATGNLSYTTAIRQATSPDFAIYSGNDDVIVPLMSVGGSGVISVLANALPQETHDMVAACLEGDYERARSIQLALYPFIEALFVEVNPVPIKAALNLLGLPSGGLRLPLSNASEATVDRLRQELQALGYLKPEVIGGV